MDRKKFVCNIIIPHEHFVGADKMQVFDRCLEMVMVYRRHMLKSALSYVLDLEISDDDLNNVVISGFKNLLNDNKVIYNRECDAVYIEDTHIITFYEPIQNDVRLMENILSIDLYYSSDMDYIDSINDQYIPKENAEQYYN